MYGPQDKKKTITRMNPILATLYSRGTTLTRSLLLNFEMARSRNKGELIFCVVGALSNVGFLSDASYNVPKLRDRERDFGREISSGKLAFLLRTGSSGLTGLTKIGMGVGGN